MLTRQHECLAPGLIIGACSVRDTDLSVTPKRHNSRDFIHTKQTWYENKSSIKPAPSGHRNRPDTQYSLSLHYARFSHARQENYGGESLEVACFLQHLTWRSPDGVGRYSPEYTRSVRFDAVFIAICARTPMLSQTKPPIFHDFACGLVRTNYLGTNLTKMCLLFFVRGAPTHKTCCWANQRPV